MIQRIQTVFLILTDVVLVVLLFVPYASATAVTALPDATQYYTLMDNPGLLVGQIVLCVLAALTVVMFRKRPLQMKLATAGIILSLIYTFLLMYNSIFPLVGVHWTIEPGTYISLGNFLMFLLARIFIKRDEDLVKSMDRIR